MGWPGTTPKAVKKATPPYQQHCLTNCKLISLLCMTLCVYLHIITGRLEEFKGSSHLKMLMIQPGGDPGSKLWLQAGLKTRLQPGLDMDQITVNVPVLMPKLRFNPCERGARNLFVHLYKNESSNAKWVVNTTVYEISQ